MAGGSSMDPNDGVGGATVLTFGATIVSAGQTQTVSSGQRVSGCIILPGGSQTILAHGSAAATEVSGGGVQVVFGGASGTVVDAVAAEYVQSGGFTIDTVVSSGGDEFVESGGQAFRTAVTGGSLVVYGSANSAVLSSGAYLYLETGRADFTSVSSGGIGVIVGLAFGTVVASGGFDFVFSGGAANSTVLSGGVEYVEAGATAFDTVAAGGAQVVYGTVSGTTLYSGAYLYLEPGSTASGVAVSSGIAGIYGSARQTFVASGGFDYVQGGGSVSATVLSGGAEFVETGAVANGTTILHGAQVVYGVTTGTQVESGSYEYVYPGGTASGTIVTSGVESIFGSAFGTIDRSGGADYVYAGIASGTIVSRGGDEFVEPGASALATLVSGANGGQLVYGTALGTILASGGDQIVENGGVASATVIDSGGYEYVGSGGTALDATISGGTMEVASGAVAGGTIGFTAYSSGELRLDKSRHFSGTLARFGQSDEVDLADIAFGSSVTIGFQEAAGNASGTLTVANGAFTANLTLLGQYAAGEFHLADDGSGGTLVTDSQPAAGFDYSVSLSDTANVGSSTDAVLVYDLQQALGVWAGYIAGEGTLVVQLNITDTTFGRESGGPTSFQFAGTDSQGNSLFESSAFYELTTGNHVSGTTSDITITVDPQYLQYLDLAPGLTYPSQVPDTQYNPIIVFLHEIMHGLGMVGFYTQSGTISQSRSTFDTLISTTPSGAFFTGASAEAAYGGPVPLTTNSTAGENYYHFGDQQSDLSRTPATVQELADARSDERDRVLFRLSVCDFGARSGRVEGSGLCRG